MKIKRKVKARNDQNKTANILNGSCSLYASKNYKKCRVSKAYHCKYPKWNIQVVPQVWNRTFTYQETWDNVIESEFKFGSVTTILDRLMLVDNDWDDWTDKLQ